MGAKYNQRRAKAAASKAKRRASICKHTGKRRYATSMDAEAIVGRGANVRVYLCEFCDGHHTTSQRKRNRQQ